MTPKSCESCVSSHICSPHSGWSETMFDEHLDKIQVWFLKHHCWGEEQIHCMDSQHLRPFRRHWCPCLTKGTFYSTPEPLKNGPSWGGDGQYRSQNPSSWASTRGRVCCRIDKVKTKPAYRGSPWEDKKTEVTHTYPGSRSSPETEGDNGSDTEVG